MITEEILEKQDVRKRSKESLYFFTKSVLGKNLLTPHLHLPLCNYLQILPKGYFPDDPITRPRYGDWTTLRKIVWLTRTHYKSTICSESFPPWLLINNRNLTIALVSANDKNTKKWLRSIKQTILYNDYFRWAFPEIRPGSKWDETEIIIERDINVPQASIEALSLKSGLASQHYDVIIADDLINEQTAQSSVEMQKAVELYEYLEDVGKELEHTIFNVIGTPWGTDDVLALARKQETAGNRVMWGCGALGDFKVSEKLAHIPEIRPKIVEGQPIHPKACGWTKLNKIKKENMIRYVRQYLCDPYAENLNGFQINLIKNYSEYPDGRLLCDCHPEHDHTLRNAAVVSVSDPAFTEDKKGCESAILIGAKFACGCRFLLEEWGDHVTTAGYIDKACEIATKRKTWLKRFGIESVNFQLALGTWLKDRADRGEFPLNVELPEKGSPAFLKPAKRDKDARISSQITPVINGYWHVKPTMQRNHNPEAPNLLEQLYRWPFSRKRDRADAFGYFDDCWEGISPSTYEDPESEELDINIWRQQEDMALIEQEAGL